MIVLAIDGALGGFSAAVARDGAIAASERLTGSVALELGLAAVRQVMSRAGVRAENLDRLAVGAGPGGFTGLRIAVSYAKSLAQAWRRPLVAISSFDLLECGVRADPALTTVEGRPGVISARLRQGERVERASGRIADVLDLLLANGPGRLTTFGAAKDVLAALAERGIVVHPYEPPVTPAAAAAAQLAAAREPASSAHAVRADYGELPAARIPPS